MLRDIVVAKPKLNLYRRHGSHCVADRALDARNYETDEPRRGWKKCRCPIYASGTLNRVFRRKNTEHVSWVEAKEVAALMSKMRSLAPGGRGSRSGIPVSGRRILEQNT